MFSRSALRLTPRADLAPFSVDAEAGLSSFSSLIAEPLTYVKKNLLDFWSRSRIMTHGEKTPTEFRKYLAKLGKKGGLKGGPARAAAMTPDNAASQRGKL